MTMERLHPLSAVLRVASYGANGFAIPAVLSLVAGGFVEARVGVGGGDLFAVLAPAGLVAGATFGYLSYRRFAYELTPDTFDVASGVVGRTEREIPIRRIQNVDIQQNLVHQLFDVAVIRIETAGGGGTEATLSVVGLDEAHALQRGIRERRARLRASDDGDGDSTTEGASVADDASAAGDVAGASGATVADDATAIDDGAAATRAKDEERWDGDPDTWEGDSDTWDEDAAPGREGAEDWSDERGEWTAESYEPLLSLRVTDLLVLAATNFQLGSLLFVLVGFPLAGDLATNVLLAVAEPLGGPESIDPSAMTVDQYVVLGGTAGPLVLVAGYVLSAVRAVLEYYEFELGRRGNDLVYERGLFQRYSGSIPTDKIQTLTVRETAPMRWLGFAALDVETAGYGSGSGGGGGTQAAVPVAVRARVTTLAHDLFEYDDVALERPPKRARQRYAVRYALVVLAVLAIAYGASALLSGFTLWYVPAVALLVVPVAAHLKWVHRGYALTDDHVVVRTGFWRRRTHVVPYYRLQTIVGEATVFQRRRDLASLVADTASSATLARSAPTAHDLDADDVSRLQRDLRDRLQAHLRGDRRPVDTDASADSNADA
ncbi:PH domain-containing protein [Halorubellus sp. JP-L1]|uniref:PH domain-containing protein n=1 Tax=Halorubellus sp. JP-L1 TaxID=2715753 RepID=UPI00140C0E67|nr:PH domain-containing protein [Halorubellus sp. JP-L1]NHN40801.1 PH domain-containing protein [Halorubellus sp. JP-L1]